MDKRHRILSPAAFGIHFRVSSDIRAFVESRLKHSTFFFYEHFLEKPFTIGDELAAVLRVPQSITSPFLSRVAYKTGFIPALNEDTVRRLNVPNDIESLPLCQEGLSRYWHDLNAMHLKIEDTDTLALLTRHWLEADWTTAPTHFTLPTTPDLFATPPTVFTDDGVVSVVGALSTVDLRDKYPQELIDRVKKDAGYANVALAKLREYELVLRPWVRSREMKEIGIIAASLSSKAVFWGQCIVLYPTWPNTPEDSVEKLRTLLNALIRLNCAPMLTLLENYLYEDDLATRLTSGPDGTPSAASALPYHDIGNDWIRTNQSSLRALGTGAAVPKTLNPKIGQPPARSHVFVNLAHDAGQRDKLWALMTKIERSLVELWADRLGWINEMAQAVHESLVFAKYLVASPAMVDCTAKAIGMKHMAETKKKCAVKTALVVGGPGSGKDSMAQLIRLFSPGYRFGRVKTFNMAMFRPKEAAVPLLLGLDAGIEPSRYQVTLTGLLERAIKNVSPPPAPRPGQRTFAFILDELNSLDIDTQGALLRLLENAELQPLGGLDPTVKEFDLLVIGVMNEDPQMIMKRRAMERVLREKQLFGGLVGEAVYEIFRQQRRLRDDLYYRMIRGGELYLPELRDRREDLPLLFYFIVKTDLVSLFPEKVRDRWDVELSVYEELMDRSLAWEGNLRELQTIARQIVMEAVVEYEMHGSDDADLLIRGAHAKRGIENHQAGRTTKLSPVQRNGHAAIESAAAGES